MPEANRGRAKLGAEWGWTWDGDDGRTHWVSDPDAQPDPNDDERAARDAAFKATGRFTPDDGRLWDEAWAAARDYYAPNMDEANALRERLGLDA